jgi:hypothetical protein
MQSAATAVVSTMSHPAFHSTALLCPLPAGYDLIIDQDLKPWLLEVNASPSLSANTKEDYLMKCEMLNGMLDVVDMEGVLRGDEEHVSGACMSMYLAGGGAVYVYAQLV